MELKAAEFDTIMLIFRVLMGLTFASHGYAKMFSGGKIAGTAGWFDSIGMKPGRIHALAASITEMGAGVLLAIGLLTPFAGAAVIGVMLVAGYTVHRGHFHIVKGGWEFTFINALMAAVIAGLGPGRFSLDRALGIDDSLNGYTGLILAVVIGVVAGAAQLAIFFRPPAPAPAAAA